MKMRGRRSRGTVVRVATACPTNPSSIPFKLEGQLKTKDEIIVPLFEIRTSTGNKMKM